MLFDDTQGCRRSIDMPRMTQHIKDKWMALTMDGEINGCDDVL